MAYIVVFGSGNGVNRSSHSGRDVSHVALRAEEPDGVRPSMVVFYRPSFATNGVRQFYLPESCPQFSSHVEMRKDGVWGSSFKYNNTQPDPVGSRRKLTKIALTSRVVIQITSKQRLDSFGISRGTCLELEGGAPSPLSVILSAKL